MRMMVLSHAGLLVEGSGRQLACDPWLVGSCYWRSWWNYPPVSEETLSQVKPDFIYLTHLHWDHFQGPSLRRFSMDTPILIPYDRYTRMRDDLRKIGFKTIMELHHGQSYHLADDFKVTSYHFSPFTDSALVIECEDVTIFNANDAKLMGLPLGQILNRHPKIDFALRSHSSANARLSYQYIDHPNEMADDTSAYSRAFCAFMHRVRPRYAIPFASNTCHLHKDTQRYNALAVSPYAVAADFADYQRRYPTPTELRVMVSGDSWDSRDGFHITPSPWLDDREVRLAGYIASRAPVLEKTYAEEARSTVSLKTAERFLGEFADAIPHLLRRAYRGRPVLFDVVNGDSHTGFLFDLYAGLVTQVDPAAADPRQMRIIIPARIFKQALVLRMFAHAAISKRVTWRATKADMPLLNRLEGLLSWYEYEVFPLHRFLRWRLLRAYAPRWRELVLYAQLVVGKLMGKSLRSQELRYLDDPALKDGRGCGHQGRRP